MHDLPPELGPLRRDSSPFALAPRWHTALLVALLAGFSLLGARPAHHPDLAAHHTARYIVSLAFEWIMLLLTWWGLRLRRIPLSQLLGFRHGLRAFAEDFGAAAIFWVMAMAILAAVNITLRLLHFSSPQKAIAALAPRTPLEMLLWIVLSLSAGYCEETVFRGYFLRQFASRRLWIGVLASSLLFGISHGYEGIAGMIAITIFGALFCALAIARNSLRPGMIAHAWHDIFTGVALVVLRFAHRL